MSLTQLNPTIWLDTPKGVGLAHFVLDYGEEHDVIWGVCIDATGEWWWFPNPEVRGVKNTSLAVPRDRAKLPARTLYPGAGERDANGNPARWNM